MKCREQRNMYDVKITKTPRGTYMAKGKCPICECKMCKMMSANNAEQYISDGEATADF